MHTNFELASSAGPLPSWLLDLWIERFTWSTGQAYIYIYIQPKDKCDISYLNTSRAFIHSDPFKCSPGSHSQLVGSCSV